MSQQVSDYEGWIGHKMLDSSGDKIGTIEQIYLDTDSGKPEWLTVKTGLLGTKVSFVPTGGARADGQDLRISYSKDHVKDAPSIDPDGALSYDEEGELYSHYGLDSGSGGESQRQGSSGAGGSGSGGRSKGTVGRDVSGPETDEAMTRSEEELNVGTRSAETGRVRLKKHVVTEQVQTTVPVQHEEVRLEREPITDENVGDATSGADISEEEHEIVLHEEVPVVEKKTVAKERVRLDKETVSDEHEVSEEIRKEQIEVDDQTDKRR